MSSFLGYLVSIDCRKSLGTFQGQISSIDPSNQAITLLKVYQNGVPYPTQRITINADDIENISIIEEATKIPTPSELSHVTVKKPVAKRAGRSISESLAVSRIRDSPRKPDEETRGLPAALGDSSKTPSKRDRQRQKWTDRDEACFNTPINDIVEDFDFEKNLALFNKQAVYREIDAAQRPDVVRQTDGGGGRGAQYRHDENVIACAPAVWRQIAVSAPDTVEYVTDDGLVVPSVTAELRHQLFAVAERVGLGCERQAELMGRAATEMALQLLGGGHRLSPHNAHQWPTVVALCGSHAQGAIGVNAARQLASHGVKTVVFLLDPVSLTPQLAHEVALYRLTGNKIISSVQVTHLPHSVDLIVLACASQPLPAGYRATAAWANEMRAPVLALDPPRAGSPFVDTKFSLVPVLPLAHHAQNGKIYLCNLAFPLHVFQEVGIKYTSPFGPKFVIALHPNDDAPT